MTIECSLTREAHRRIVFWPLSRSQLQNLYYRRATPPPSLPELACRACYVLNSRMKSYIKPKIGVKFAHVTCNLRTRLRSKLKRSTYRCPSAFAILVYKSRTTWRRVQMFTYYVLFFISSIANNEHIFIYTTLNFRNDFYSKLSASMEKT